MVVALDHPKSAPASRPRLCDSLALFQKTFNAEAQ
jgi:hypothetical protein